MYFNKDVHVSISNRFITHYPRMHLYENNFYPILGVIINNQLVESENTVRYVTIQGLVPEIQFVSLKPEAEKPVSTLITSFTFKPCKEVEDSKPRDNLYGSNEQFRDFGKYYGLCPDLTPEDIENLYVESNIVNPPFRWLQINILPCILNDPTLCATEDEINQGGEIIFTLPKLNFNPDNFNNPLSIVGSTDEDYLLSTQVKGSKLIILKTFELYDDIYDFIPEKIHSKYTEIESVESNFVSRVSNTKTYCDPTIESITD